MGPKNMKKEGQKRENGTVNDKKLSIEDDINTTSWRCVVMMAVERSYYDSFVLKEFIEEASSGRRQEVNLIDFDTFVMKILNDFANGELPYKYAFLLNFSSVFQEAVDYISKKRDIPLLVLVKVVKALLFYFREESLMRIEKMESSPADPIKAMEERPANLDSVDAKKKELAKKGDNGFKVRPPSVTKRDTELLKRGERAKDDQCVDDAPQNAYFNLYVLLSGFYNPDLPLELIKANIPLHAILCIDTSLSGVKRDPSWARNKFQKRFEARLEEIQNFWKVFLKKLWDPQVSFLFKDTIFQVYVPQRLLCEKNKLREFIYREISYLMYDLSDLKRQLANYLDHMQLWDVSEKGFEDSGALVWPENLPNECASVPIILQCIIDTICKTDWKYHESLTSDSIDSGETASGSLDKYFSESKKAMYGSCTVGPGWSEELEEREDFNLMSIYLKTKELDVKYDLYNKSVPSGLSEKAFVEANSSHASCNFQPQVCAGNMEEILLSPDGIFRSYWQKYSTDVKTLCAIDYCVYALLMTKVFCPYQAHVETCPTTSFQSLKKNSNFELIENLSQEMRKPHFTVTDGSRSILKAAPFNMKSTSRDFFCPEEFKVVSPEKLKASSAPVFRVAPSLKVQALYTSEIFPVEISKTPFENLRGFVNENLFLNTNGFDFLEFLSKPKLLEKEYEHWSNYNCIDHTYSLLNDCILLMLHNRKDSEGVHHETFNQTLKTVVGLRDFYEYVLEDEAAWLALQEESYQTRIFLANTVLQSDSYRDLADSNFWLPNSIKYQTLGNKMPDEVEGSKEVKIEASSTEKFPRGKIYLERQDTYELNSFEGYHVSDMAIQFSGLKTIYYSNDCNVAVQLIERLYGNQDLGIHVTESSHTLHLHSYVCPEPHILDPFTFHVTYKNGIVIAFGSRLVENFEEIEEKMESLTTIKSKKNSSEMSTTTVIKQIPKKVKDEEFVYSMGASLPNGLSIRTVRRIAKPCYIKQCYLVASEEAAENRRLFLPNGNVIKMMSNSTVQILKADASIITANLSDLIKEADGENINFSKYEVIDGEGCACSFEQGQVTSSKRFQVFQNTDMDTNQIFFRRRDGTNYMLQSDGTLCVQFQDGTKMSSSLLVQEPPPQTESDSTEEKNPEENSEEIDPAADFVFVFVKIVAEHPDYATVIHDSRTQKWRILLPQDSTITVEPNGCYFVEIDKQTELKVEADLIQMNKFSCEREPECSFTADLSVFENKEGVYCRMKDSTGKTFIVEGNSNCYILKNEGRPEGNDPQKESSVPVDPGAVEYADSVDRCPPMSANKSNKLFPENKYFVVRRDITGAEIFHSDDVSKILKRRKKGSLVYTQTLPGTENRCFVLVTPEPRREVKKWGVKTILPDPKYEPGGSKKTSSSTYGVPPSWMHPFPKRKFKFVVPQPLTCRVFVETKKTELSPDTGTLDCYYCEMSAVSEAKHSQIPPEGVEDYLKRLSNDDQDLLTEIYSLAAASLKSEKKKSRPMNSKKLEHYLEMSKYYVAMREYHKKCIRYHTISNYFQHPAGMSWLIINRLLLKLQPSEERIRKQIWSERTADGDKSPRSSEATSEFSNEEIEYNLSVSAGQSFSSLSCRSNLSAQTAPIVLTTGGVCRCKVSGVKDVASSPVVKCSWRNDALLESNYEGPPAGICDFQECDIDLLEKNAQDGGREIPIMSLEDLMYLGLI